MDQIFDITMTRIASMLIFFLAATVRAEGNETSPTLPNTTDDSVSGDMPTVESSTALDNATTLFTIPTVSVMTPQINTTLTYITAVTEVTNRTTTTFANVNVTTTQAPHNVTIVESTTTANLSHNVTQELNVTFSPEESTAVVANSTSVFTKFQTTQNPIGTTSVEAQTTASASPTIAQNIKDKWNDSISMLNFSATSLNETLLKGMSGSEVIEVIISFFQSKDASEVIEVAQENNISDVVSLFLKQKPQLLETNIRKEFDTFAISNLNALFANLYWFHDQILSDNEYLQNLAEMYAPLTLTGHNQTSAGNESEAEITPVGFIQFIFSNSTPDSLFETLCGKAEEEEITISICPIIAQTTEETESPSTTANLLAPEKLENVWRDLLDENYPFLSDIQVEQLGNVSPENMTSALVTYVKDMTDNEIQVLLDTNITFYVNKVLRSDGNTPAMLLGNDVVKELGGNANKEDIYYVFLNFLNGFLADPEKFNKTLQVYVGYSDARRRKRAILDCDTTAITAEGLVCHIIITEGNNVTSLLMLVCEELNGGADCTSTKISDPVVNQDQRSGLTAAQIAGIAVGCVLGVLLILIIAFFIWKRCLAEKTSKVSPHPSRVGNNTQQGFVRTHTSPPSNHEAPSRMSVNGSHPNDSSES